MVAQIPRFVNEASREETVAKRIVKALQKGMEDIPIGAVAEEIIQCMAVNPKEIERAIRL